MAVALGPIAGATAFLSFSLTSKSSYENHDHSVHIARASDAENFSPNADSAEVLSDPDPAFLPIQVGAIAGAYGVSLVVVAFFILVLSKRRREILAAGDNETDFIEEDTKPLPPNLRIVPPTSPRSIPRSPVRTFSGSSPDRADLFFPSPQTPYIAPSPSSSACAPGVDLSVDQRVVATDRQMAQTQLEEMYKYVLEHEEAKQQGIILQDTPVLSTASRTSTSDQSSSTGMSRKEKNKPAQLNLSKEDKTQSRTSSILSALRSPRKKSGVKGMVISSPMMTPKSGTFPGPESQEMNTIPPRHYAPLPPPPPPPPPPVPSNQAPFGAVQQLRRPSQGQISPVSPGPSPESTQSIDERIGAHLAEKERRSRSAPRSETDPASASSETPLIGLPGSPKPSITRFPPLPSSPKPGATFQKKAPPSAVRTGGTLPLRAYEPAVASPTSSQTVTKQTVFARAGPLSPMTARTPGTAVPYSPYQPFTPCMPMTPSLVSRADRKRMKKLEPKTPTMELVQEDNDIW
ncbi:hypothetical protein SODALDRAFT_325884 [Sodiomyces alkalinus F11]|uniref:Uncharacterized protein n=1 Tax=Sodiomyces alkalinus (strain CBS 110278 / VKM F-3762 / F11) TaxID=1314773 RepID=A0A3N2PPZ1_SODAK|nr:hypothetical protein SODALDRAFT_325884 [Sodiomyces alkalinus F11]ROT36565.1 hypothetical protein SODALDRAFT_325884 [Sodiomyces alkalinus F11]